MSALAVAGWLAGGGGVGTLHFTLLRWQAGALVAATSRPPLEGGGRGEGSVGGSLWRRSVAGGPPSPQPPPSRGGGVTALAPLRLIVTTAVLYFAARHGALPLLLTAAGILLARPVMLRWVP